MKLAYDFYKSFLLINKNLTKNIFIEKTGAKSGYSLNMFSRMYDSITSELIDVEWEYKKFYSFEYKTLEQYLYRKYNIKEEYIIELMEVRRSNPDCVLYRMDELSYGGNGDLNTFAFSETMFERISEILMLKKTSK